MYYNIKNEVVMKNPLILTIDFGTQSVRASIFDKHGNCLAMHKKVYEPAYHSPKNIIIHQCAK